MLYIKKTKKSNNQPSLVDFAQEVYTKNKFITDIKKHLPEIIKNVGFVYVIIRENYPLENYQHNLCHWCVNTRSNVGRIREKLSESNLKNFEINQIITFEVSNIKDRDFGDQFLKKQIYELKQHGAKTQGMERLDFSLTDYEVEGLKSVIKNILLGKNKEAEDDFYELLGIFFDNEKTPIFTKK